MTYRQTPNFRTPTFGDAWWVVNRNGIMQLIETAGLTTTVQLQTILFNGVPTGSRTFDGTTPHQVRIDGVIGPDSLRALWSYAKNFSSVPAAAFSAIQADARANRISWATWKVALWLTYNQPRHVDVTEGPTNARRRVRRTDSAILWAAPVTDVNLSNDALLPQWLGRPAIPVNVADPIATPQVTALAADGTRTTDVIQVPNEAAPPPEAALVPESTTPVGTTPTQTPAPAVLPAAPPTATPDTTASDTTSSAPGTSAPAAPTNYVPWILGGLAVAAAVGIGIAVTRKKDAPHPALGPSGRPVSAGAAPPPHANPSDRRGSTSGSIDQQSDVPRWVGEHGISHSMRHDRINQALKLAMKMNNREGDAIVNALWEASPTDVLQSPVWPKLSARVAARGNARG